MHDIEGADEGFLAPIDKVILHENFESDYIHDTNDIALIRLRNPVKFDENVRPVCLPHKGSLSVVFLCLTRLTSTWIDHICYSLFLSLFIMISDEPEKDQ